MPYQLKPEGSGWVVYNMHTGKKYSKEPMPKSRAQRQMNALYAAEQEQASITGKSEGNTGVMVAVYIKEPYASMLQAITSNVLQPIGADIMSPDYLHITLAYIGDANDLERDNPGTKEKLLRALNTVADEYKMYQGDSGWCGSVNGIARFFPLDEELATPLVYTFDSSCMSRWRAKIVDAIESQLANIDESHGFLAHITSAYIPRFSSIPDIRFSPIEMTIDEICLEWGDERYSFCLCSELESTPAVSSSSLVVYKEAKTGISRWLNVSSTSFQDRDREWVTTKSLQRDEVRGDLLAEMFGTAVAYGPLRWGHVGYPYLTVKNEWMSATAGPGIDIGWCDFSTVDVSKHGASLIESGTFVDPIVAKAVADHVDELGTSLTFAHPIIEPGEPKVYWDIRKVERSLLYRDRPSNLGTFMSVKEANMMSKDKIRQLVDLGVPRDHVDQFVQKAEARRAELAAQGIISKEVNEEGGNEADVLVAALDGMQSGLLALKEYVTKASGLKGAGTSRKPSGPKVEVDDGDEDDGDEETTKGRGKAFPFKAKEDGEGLIELKAFTEGLTRWETGFLDATRQMLEGFTAKMTAAVEASGSSVAEITSKQSGIDITLKEVAGNVAKLTDYMKTAMGELPPGLVDITGGTISGNNLIGPHNAVPEGSHLRQKEIAGDEFSKGTFSWLDEKMFGSGDQSTQAVVASVLPTQQ